MIKYYDLVIIGGGAAGLASALKAYDEGITNILILEKEPYLGGILLQCIHNGFGLHHFKEELSGPEYAERFIKMIKERNIEYLVDTMVLNITKDLQVHYSNNKNGYIIIQAKAIICATGCSERTRGAINLPGDRVAGVMTAGIAQKYINIDGYNVGKKVFILGSGDIGLIMARRMTLEGATVLGVAEIMPYSSGLNRNIVQCLEDYNIPLYLKHTVKDIIGKDRLEKIVIAEVDEKFNFIDGSEKHFDVDTLLLSVGLIPSNPLLEKLSVKLHPRTKGPIVDEVMQTSIKGIFACGNSLHVHDLVDFVSSEGYLAGLSASKYIKNTLSNNVNKLEIKAGRNISYVVPSTINLENIDKITIKYRVSKPIYSKKVIIKYNGIEIKKIAKAYLFPSEMEHLEISKDVIKGSNGTLTLEVLDNEN